MYSIIVIFLKEFFFFSTDHYYLLFVFLRCELSDFHPILLKFFFFEKINNFQRMTIKEEPPKPVPLSRLSWDEPRESWLCDMAYAYRNLWKIHDVKDVTEEDMVCDMRF